MQRVLKTTLNVIILFFLLITLAGAFASKNLNGQLLGIIGVIVVVLGYLTYLFRHHLTTFPKLPLGVKKVLTSPWLWIGLVAIYQLTILICLATDTGFDTGILKWAASSQEIDPETYLANYFSNYPNNLVLMFVERWIFKFVGMAHFTITLDAINLVFIDIAVVLLAIFLKRHLKATHVQALVPLLFVLSPWLLLFYSDTTVLPFVAGMLVLLDLLISRLTTQPTIGWLLVLGGGLGIVSWLAYALKPTAVILLIAAVIELIIYLLKNTAKLKYQHLAFAIIACGLTFGICQGGNQYFVKHQTFVPLNTNLKMLPSHFIMMGMNKDSNGGYSQDDFTYSAKQPTSKAQQAANMKQIKQRLSNFGVVGYLSFLVHKNYLNTNDGTLGWLNEGDFFSKPKFNHYEFLRSFFYTYGSRLRYYQTFSQLIWLGVLIGVLFSFIDGAFIARVLRLTVLGMLLYLLLFEGGRARYIIQFMPIIYSLAVIGWHHFIVLTKERPFLKLNLNRWFSQSKS